METPTENSSPQKSPQKIDPHSPSEMMIEWQGGERFAVPYSEIRFACPCAHCVDEMTGKRVLQREKIRPDIKPKNVELIGRYALKINWNDHHSTGMYSFDLLYKICQNVGLPLS